MKNLLAFLGIACWFNGWGVAASPLGPWTLRYPPVTSESLIGVTYGAGKYVAVGRAGTVLTSNDASSWEVQSLGGDIEFLDASYANGRFFACGKREHQAVMFVSTNGSNWLRQPLESMPPLSKVAYGNGRYVAGGSPTYSLSGAYSLDGHTWYRLNVDGNYLNHLIFHNGMFWAADYAVHKSVDGLRWTKVSDLPSVKALAGMGPAVVAAAIDGRIHTSLDEGATWVTHQIGPPYFGRGNIGYLSTLAATDDLFAGVVAGYLVSSRDGSDWASVDLGTNTFLSDVVIGPDKLVGVGFGGGVLVASLSSGEVQQIGGQPTLYNIAAGPENLVAVGPDALLTSPDGENWTYQRAGRLSDVVYGAGQYVAIGSKPVLVQVGGGRGSGPIYGTYIRGIVLTSPDGLGWTQIGNTVASLPLHSIAFGNGTYVAVGSRSALGQYGSVVITSTDGRNWTNLPDPQMGLLRKAVFGKGTFVIFGGAAYATSTDGKNWSEASYVLQPDGMGHYIESMTFGDGVFVALVNGDKLYYSSDLKDWQLFGELEERARGVLYGSGRLVCFGGGGQSPSRIVSSTDGDIWTEETYASMVNLLGGVHTKNSFYLVGTAGTILQSATVQPGTWLELAAGRYDGLFHEAGGVYQHSSGYLKLRVSDTASYDGSLLHNGTTHALRGQFDAQTQSSTTLVRRANDSPLRLSLQLEGSLARQRIVGTVAGGSWRAKLTADQSPFNAQVYPAPFAGRYTVVLPPDRNSPEAPAGFGYASVTVSPSGKVRAEGRLADNQPFSQISYISGEGYWPLYTSLYQGGGSLMGWMKFVETGGLANKRASWIRPTLSGAHLFPEGFQIEVRALGSVYKPSSGRVLPWRRGVLILTGKELVYPMSVPILLTERNTIQSLWPYNVSGQIDPANGVFRGSLKQSGGVRLYTFQGAVLQDKAVGLGFFMSPPWTGQVRLEGNGQ